MLAPERGTPDQSRTGAPVPARYHPRAASKRVRSVLMTADAVGGVWRYSIDLARAFSARGISTTLAVMGPPPDLDQRREAESAGVPVVIRPYRLEWMDDPWADVERAGKWLVVLGRTLQPDIVHLNGYAHAALPWSAPVVIVAHSCVRSWWRAVKGQAPPGAFDTYREAVTRGLAAARLVVAPSAAMLAALDEEYGVPTRSRVIPNGIAADTAPLSPGKERVILAAGRVWDEAKNVAAVCDVAGDWPWPVYVAGDDRGPDGTARQLPNVQALGRLSAANLREWQRRAGVFVSPARYEPFGLSILEAAAAGCALVLGDIPSLRENWDGAALFAPPDDRSTLRRAVSTLIDDEALRCELAERASRHARQFTIDRAADEYVRAYGDVSQ